MAENKPKLGYWQSRGAAGPAKLLLGHLGVDYEMVEYAHGGAPDFDRSSWNNVKADIGVAYPNLPYWIDGDVKMSEQVSILRQIVRKYRPEYLGRTLKEQGSADMFCNLLKEQFFATQIITCYMGYEEKKETMKSSAKEFATKFMEFKGESKFAVGSEPTYPDFMAYEWIKRCAAHDPSFLETTGIAAYQAALEELSGFEDYNKDADSRAWNNQAASWGT